MKRTTAFFALLAISMLCVTAVVVAMVASGNEAGAKEFAKEGFGAIGTLAIVCGIFLL